MFISSVAEDAAEGDLADYYRSQHAAWGFLPNYATAFSTRTDVVRAWNALSTTIRDGMDRRRYEIATIAAARAVDRLRDVGLSDADVADVVFASSARCFFTAVLDGLGAQLDPQTAKTFPPALLESMTVGRPVAGA